MSWRFWRRRPQKGTPKPRVVAGLRVTKHAEMRAKERYDFDAAEVLCDLALAQANGRIGPRFEHPLYRLPKGNQKRTTYAWSENGERVYVVAVTEQYVTAITCLTAVLKPVTPFGEKLAAALRPTRGG